MYHFLEMHLNLLEKIQKVRIEYIFFFVIFQIKCSNAFIEQIEIMHEGIAFTSSQKTPFYGWFLGFILMILDRPEDVHTVLTSKSCIEKAPIYKFFNRGMALFTAPGKNQ